MLHYGNDNISNYLHTPFAIGGRYDLHVTLHLTKPHFLTLGILVGLPKLSTTICDCILAIHQVPRWLARQQRHMVDAKFGPQVSIWQESPNLELKLGTWGQKFCLEPQLDWAMAEMEGVSYVLDSDMVLWVLDYREIRCELPCQKNCNLSMPE